MNNNYETSFHDAPARGSKNIFYPLIILVSIASIIIGILITGVIIISSFNKHAKLQRFETTEAEIVDILEKEETRSYGSRRSHSRRTVTTTVYASVYEYEVDGDIYEFRSNVYSSTPPRIGDFETIYYDPEDPEDSLLNNSFTFEIVLICFGILHITIWAVIAAVFNKKRKAV